MAENSSSHPSGPRSEFKGSAIQNNQIDRITGITNITVIQMERIPQISSQRKLQSTGSTDAGLL
ncbi:hypothetical protein Hdeb2414_s0033g00725001 [Helianthus debilis subsp. tardiflorus]